MNTVIVIPVYNEAGAVGQVIEDVRAHGFEHIIVVDDGSSDESWCVASAHDVLVLPRSIVAKEQQSRPVLWRLIC